MWENVREEGARRSESRRNLIKGGRIGVEKGSLNYVFSWDSDEKDYKRGWQCANLSLIGGKVGHKAQDSQEKTLTRMMSTERGNGHVLGEGGWYRCAR